METHAERKLEYHPDTGALYFIGEATHGVWRYPVGNGTYFWYCAMGVQSSWTGDGDKLWSTVVRSMEMNKPEDIDALGLVGSTYGNPAEYNVIRLYPIQGKTRVLRNSIEGEINEEDYEELTWEEIKAGRYFYYHKKSSNYTAIAIQFPDLAPPPGVARNDTDLHDYNCPQNYSNCDGYLIDIALKTTLTFEANAFNDLRTVIDEDNEDETVIVTPGVFDEVSQH